MCGNEIGRGSIDSTGTDVTFAFHVVERVAAAHLNRSFYVTPGLGSIDVLFSMPIVTFETRDETRASPRFHELSVGQQAALARHFRTVRQLSPEQMERRRAHLRNAEKFFREG